MDQKWAADRSATDTVGSDRDSKIQRTDHGIFVAIGSAGVNYCHGFLSLNGWFQTQPKSRASREKETVLAGLSC
jgi:hypothetical protein